MTAPTLTAPDAWATVTRAQSGDPDAFAELYERYRDTVLRYIARRVACRYTAEDLAQDVWVRAARNLTRVHQQGVDFGAWLVTIARNIVADHYGSGRVRLSTLVEDLQLWDLRASDDPEREAVASVSRAAAERLLTEAMSKLTPTQRRVIVLRFYDGLSTNETAAAMSQELTASKTLQYRAVQALRRRIAEVSA